MELKIETLPEQLISQEVVMDAVTKDKNVDSALKNKSLAHI